jgi:hypothetical protein
MATLFSIEGNVQLQIRLLRTTLDPFQQDLEWFEYELSIESGSADQVADAPAAAGERRSARGRINRKEFNQLLRGLGDLIEHSVALRFEPRELNFYFEWSHETPQVFLIVTWFDLALTPRTLERRFPGAHAGYRFLADRDSLRAFRMRMGAEFDGRVEQNTVI